MQSGTHRAIAIAPVGNDMKVMGGGQGVFPFSVNLPQYYPALGYHSGSGGNNSRVVPSSRSGACASRHMAAEQRRRARINERLDALRSLVPHSARANTAAFLTEVYDYISTLHKQLEKVGGGVIDLNVAASDDKKEGQEHTKYGSDCKSDGESDVESRELVASHNDDNDRAFVPVSSAATPALFSSEKQDVQESIPRSKSPLWTESGKGEAHKSAFTPTCSAVCSPDNPGTANANRPPPGPESGKSASPLRNLLPASQPSDMITHYPLPGISPIHPGAVAAAAAAAVADAAAAAQSWGMAAAVAHAQAQVAAQMHVQAQAAVQAQAQAQALHARAAPSHLPGRKRRRGAANESCATRQRSLQGVVRPIALKPQ